MNKIISIVAFLLILILIACCPGKRKIVYNNFSQEDLKWAIYNIGDSITFSNNKNEIRHFIVRKIYKDTLPEMDKFSFSCTSNYFMRWTYKIYPDTAKDINRYDSPINFHIENLHKAIYISANWYDTYGYNINNEANKSITIRGKVFDDVYVAYSDTLGFKPNVLKFFYSRKYGFIRFDEYNGDVWELIFN